MIHSGAPCKKRVYSSFERPFSTTPFWNPFWLPSLLSKNNLLQRDSVVFLRIFIFKKKHRLGADNRFSIELLIEIDQRKYPFTESNLPDFSFSYPMLTYEILRSDSIFMNHVSFDAGLHFTGLNPHLQVRSFPLCFYRKYSTNNNSSILPQILIKIGRKKWQDN